MDTIKTNQIEIGGKLLDIEPDKLSGNVQINLVGDVSGSVDTPIEAGSTINIHTKLEKEVSEGGVEEAPVDNKQYARKNRTWVEVEGGGSNVNDIDFSYGASPYLKRRDNTNLPSGYTKKTAIKNNGISAIETGLDFYGLSDWSIVTSILNYTMGNQYDSIMSNEYKGEDANQVRIIISSSSTLILNADSRAGGSSLFGYTKGGILVFGKNLGNRFGLSNFYTNILANNTEAAANSSSLKLFNNINQNTSATIAFFYATMNNVCVANYIPCIRNSDGVAGFYDLLSNSFKTSEDGGATLEAI